MTNFSNESKQEVKCAESSITILVTNESEAKNVTNYSNMDPKIDHTNIKAS